MTKKKDPDSYEVGYGKPPATTQFKPGQSGNRSGRPKGSKSFDAHLQTELNRRITVTERDKRRSMSKRQLIATQVVNKAAAGDNKAIPLIANLDRQINATPPGTHKPQDLWDTAEDQLLFERVIQRIRAGECPSEDPNVNTSDGELGDGNA